jgi:hypothetical protein
MRRIVSDWAFCCGESQFPRLDEALLFLRGESFADVVSLIIYYLRGANSAETCGLLLRWHWW